MLFFQDFSNRRVRLREGGLWLFIIYNLSNQPTLIQMTHLPPGHIYNVNLLVWLSHLKYCLSCLRDVQLGGYTIPQGVQVVPHIHAVHMDPKLWDRPQEFRPERFLNAEGKVVKPDFFIPFGVGELPLCFWRLYKKESAQINSIHSICRQTMQINCWFVNYDQ